MRYVGCCLRLRELITADGKTNQQQNILRALKLSLDDSVRPRQNVRRNRKVDLLGGFEID
jgi:hypothetical protein